VRRALALDRIADVCLLRDVNGTVDLAVPDGIARVRVDEIEGPFLPASCGAEPEPTRRLVALLDSAP